ncbi:MAG TPA: hypothetical protein VFH31_01265, partial [Pyrinomonadaceae bacterium]|nr:hypothetical protein [Pyrinomonadaceae bacterium]
MFSLKIPEPTTQTFALFNISDFSTFLEKLELRVRWGLVETGEQKKSAGILPAGLLRCSRPFFLKPDGDATTYRAPAGQQLLDYLTTISTGLEV